MTFDSPYTVAVVPAKISSQRFRRKNLADLCGCPLIYYSIEAAILVPSISEVYVSSEDAKVLDVAVSYGAHTIVRPEELSQPNVSNQEVLSHAYYEIGAQTGKYPDFIVLLQPTHPLRMPMNIESALKTMSEKKGYDALFSVVEIGELRGQIINNAFIPEFPLPRNKIKEPRLYKNTGSFYVFRPSSSFLTDTFFGKK